MFNLKTKLLMTVITIFVVAGLLLSGCAGSETPTATAGMPTKVAGEKTSVSAQPTAVAASTAVPAKAQNAKYVFLFIGDGMGVPQRNAAEIYLAGTKGITDPAKVQTVKLNMNKLPAQGMTTTYDASSLIPDSASTATSLASGEKTLSGVINMDVTKTKKFETIAEVAKKKGLKVAVISSVSLDHATPAAFYAHQPSRSNMYDISMELGKSGFDFFGGGQFVQPKGKDGDKPDSIEAAKAAGYKFVIGKDDFNKLTPADGKVVVFNKNVDKDKAMPYDIDRTAEDIPIKDLVKKGIEMVDNPNGFFMIVEGGKIDWACHANDAAASIRDTLAFDEAVAEALKFYETHPNETLIVVTGDHETGGMSIGFAGTKYSAFFDKIGYQKMSYIEFGKKVEEYKKKTPADQAKFEDVLPMIQENFGLMVLSKEEKAKLDELAKNKDQEAIKKLGLVLSDNEIKILKDAFAESMKDAKVRSTDEYTYLLYGGYDPLTIKLTTILNNKAGIAWTSYSHTGAAVQTSAIGVGAEQFNGYYDNTDIYKKMVAISGLK